MQEIRECLAINVAPTLRLVFCSDDWRIHVSVLQLRIATVPGDVNRTEGQVIMKRKGLHVPATEYSSTAQVTRRATAGVATGTRV